MEFRLLGPLEVLGDDGASVQLGGKRPRAVLAMLLLNANEPVSTDRLIDGIWGESPPTSGPGAIQVHVHALRKALGTDRIVTRAPGYLVRVEPGELDIERFEGLVASGKPHDALALWRGPALADMAYELFAATEAARLEERRLAAIEARIDADLAAGRHAAVAGELDSLVASHPHRERLQGQRMLALYRAGRQAEALAAYREARAALDQLGLDPSPDLRGLERRILEHDPSLAPPREVASVSPPSTLIGRERELAAVVALLRRDDVTLVTLTGTGGTGKTTLAREAARAFAEHTFVDLSPVGDPALVMPTVARALAVEEDPGRPAIEAIADRLASERTLLLLDNLEHLPDAHVEVGRLLDLAPETTILATSRSPLRLTMEREFRVSALPLPELGESTVSAVVRSPAVRLYVERAQASLPEFELRDENANAVGRICRALDGLPLAIELAAARIRVLAPEETARRLAEGLSLLRRRAPDQPERQQSLQATIDWSYRLLDDEGRSVLRALGVFAGAVSLDEIEGVVPGTATPDVLDALLDASLVTHTVDASGKPRFGLLETLRAYARAQLVERDELDEHRRAHAAWYLSVAERAEADRAAGSFPPDALERLDRHHAEILGALGYAGEHDPDVMVRFAVALREYWRVRGLFDEATLHLERVVEQIPEPASAAERQALAGAAFFAYFRGNWERARTLGDRALAAFQDAGDSVWAARTQQMLAGTATSMGDFRRARDLCRDAAAFFRETEHWYGLALVLGSIAEAGRRLGELDDARAAISEALSLRAEHGDETLYAFQLVVLAGVAAEDGGYAEAAGLIEESLPIAVELNDFNAIPANMFIAARVAAVSGDPERAALLLGAAETALRRLGDGRYEHEREEYFDPVAFDAARTLGADRVEELRAAGRELEPSAAVALVTEVVRS